MRIWDIRFSQQRIWSANSTNLHGVTALNNTLVITNFLQNMRRISSPRQGNLTKMADTFYVDPVCWFEFQ
jgi:hypothetical protein